jgi:anti-sigma B factor antagonist
MSGGTAVMDVRELSPRTSVVDIRGDVTAASEGALMDAYSKASGPATRVLVLNFTGLEYMNSGGIGMLVTLLVRANRQRQQLLAFGLNDHYRQIFELTRLDEAIGIHETEAEALAAAGERRAGRDTP